MTAVANGEAPTKERRRAFASIVRSFRFALGLSWSAGRATTVAMVANPIIQGLVPAALALTLRGLVNALVAEIEQSGSASPSADFFIAISFGLGLLLASSAALQTFLTARNTEALDHKLSVDLLRHAETLPFSYFEHPAFQDTISHASGSPGQHTNQIIVSCVRTISTAATTITLLAVLASIEPRLLLYMAPLAPLYMYFRVWLSSVRYRLTVSHIRSRRWVSYFTSQMMTDRSMPEARVLRLGPLFIKRADERMRTIRDENVGLYRRDLAGSLTFNTFAVVAVHVALFQAADRANLGDLTVGDIAVFAGAASALRTAIEQFASNLGSIRWHIAHIEHLKEFFEITPDDERLSNPGVIDLPTTTQRVTQPKLPAPPNTPLIVDEISFTYPGATEPTLRNFSMTVGEGETVALVGRNGTGKSTLVKLISGLYLPDTGSISVSGLRTADSGEEELRRRLAVVFQHFGQYNASAAENIAMGDWQRIGNDDQLVRDIAKRVGLDDFIHNLPDGYDTLLGRAFGHTSLSGGQWQRLAIARAFARDAELMILDEPTANLDPEAEYEIFEHFKDLAHGKATLLISHRFSTLALADRIVVLSDGTVAEEGTHFELLEADGIYARLHQLYRSSGDAAGSRRTAVEQP